MRWSKKKHQTYCAQTGAGQEDVQREEIVLPRGTGVPSPRWPAGGISVPNANFAHVTHVRVNCKFSKNREMLGNVSVAPTSNPSLLRLVLGPDTVDEFAGACVAILVAAPTQLKVLRLPEGKPEP